MSFSSFQGCQLSALRPVATRKKNDPGLAAMGELIHQSQTEVDFSAPISTAPGKALCSVYLFPLTLRHSEIPPLKKLGVSLTTNIRVSLRILPRHSPSLMATFHTQDTNAHDMGSPAHKGFSRSLAVVSIYYASLSHPGAARSSRVPLLFLFPLSPSLGCRSVLPLLGTQ